MNDDQPTTSHETLPAHPVSNATSEPSVAGSREGGAGAAPPVPPASLPDSSASVTTAKQPRRLAVGRLLSSKARRPIAAAGLMCAVFGLCAACAASSSATTSSSTTATSSSAPSGRFGSGSGVAGGGGSNARSGPAAGGSSGTVDSMSPSSFTLTTSAGQKVTVNEASSTTYQSGTNSASASAVTTGEPVLVLGTTSGTTITATQVTLQPTGGVGTATSSAAAGVVPFQQGAPTTTKQTGQIPANYTEGSGTIVSGTTANKATEAALAAYPGGVVDRVVQLSNGEYEVHYIGVNWPHHIFVNQAFTVLGAD
jgi:hypothetical protein